MFFTRGQRKKMDGTQMTRGRERERDRKRQKQLDGETGGGEEEKEEKKGTDRYSRQECVL